MQNSLVTESQLQKLEEGGDIKSLLELINKSGMLKKVNSYLPGAVFSAINEKGISQLEAFVSFATRRKRISRDCFANIIFNLNGLRKNPVKSMASVNSLASGYYSELRESTVNIVEEQITAIKLKKYGKTQGEKEIPSALRSTSLKGSSSKTVKRFNLI